MIRALSFIAAIFGLAIIGWTDSAYAGFNPGSLGTPGAASQTTSTPTLGIITPQMYGAKCDGATNDRTAFFNANAAAVSIGATLSLPKGSGECVISSALTISASYHAYPGSILKPGSTITVSFTGPQDSGPYQICDISAGGMCDLTLIATPSYPEYWGCHADYSTTNTDNTACMQAAWDHGSQNLYYNAVPGAAVDRYDIATGLILHGNFSQTLWGVAGNTFTAGIICTTGLSYAYESRQTGDPYTPNYKYCVQNGIQSGTSTLWVKHAVDIDTVSPSTVIAFGMLADTTNTMAWEFNFYDGAERGYVGLHQQWANDNVFVNETLYGYQAARAISIPTGFSAASIVAKQTFIGGGFFGTRQSGNYLEYDSNSGLSNAIEANTFIGVPMEFSAYGLYVLGQNSSYIGIHFERISQTTSGSAVNEASTGCSNWMQTDLSGLNNTAQFTGGLNAGCTISDRNIVQFSPAGTCTLVLHSFTVVGSTPAATCSILKTGAATPAAFLNYVYITIAGGAGGNTSIASVGGTSFISGFPTAVVGEGSVCPGAVDDITNLGITATPGQMTSSGLFTPTWSANTHKIVISCVYQTAS